MSRVLNADDFRDRLRASLFQYHQNYRQALAVHRKRYSATLGQGTDEALEAHVRVYLINEWLTSLNWQVTSSPGYFPATIVPEAPVRSSTRHTIRFMDYLGVEANSGIPLLIVETKHPAADLPATPCTPQDIQAGLGGSNYTEVALGQSSARG